MKNNQYILFFIMLLVLMEVFCLVWCRVQCVRTECKISEENKKYENLMEAQNALKIERAKLRSLNRLSRFAEKNLNLKEPTSGQIILLP